MCDCGVKKLEAGTPRHSIDVWRGRVSEDSSTEACYVTLSGVAKRNTEASPYLAANEYIAMRLAIALNLPVVLGAIAESNDDGPLAFVSLRFGKNGEELPGVIPKHVVADHPGIAAGIVAFDMLIGNADRHYLNMAYSRDPFVSLVIFDHSHALLGPGTGGAEFLTKNLKMPMVSGCCLPPHLTSQSDLSDWYSRIAGLKQATITGACETAFNYGVIEAKERDIVIDFLIYRQRQIESFVDMSPDQFSKLKKGVSL